MSSRGSAEGVGGVGRVAGGIGAGGGIIASMSRVFGGRVVVWEEHFGAGEGEHGCWFCMSALGVDLDVCVLRAGFVGRGRGCKRLKKR